MKNKIRCWEFFKCDNTSCPAYKSKRTDCWLVSGTHCRKDIRNMFREKMEVCLECELFKKNLELDSAEETFKVIQNQFGGYRRRLDERTQELEHTNQQFENALERVNQMAVNAEYTLMELNQIINSTANGMCVIDNNFNLIRINDTLASFLNIDKSKACKKKCYEVLGSELCDGPDCLLNRVKRGDKNIEVDIERERHDGTKIPCLMTASSIRVSERDTVGIVVNIIDITDRKRMEEELRRLATIDSLTGANNRRIFLEKAQEEFERSKRYEKSLSFLMIDIDNFKKINDTYGHHVGDDVLKAMVNESHTTLRKTDIFGRLGGEEFAAVLVETDNRDAWVVAERLRQSLAQLSVHSNGTSVSFTVSIGVKTFHMTDISLEEIIRQTDEALYKAKSAGRNRVIQV